MIFVTELPKPTLLSSAAYMIKLLESGTYKLVETENNLKVLMLDDKNIFLWKNFGCSGNLEYTRLDPAQICCMLSVNNYRLYQVKNESGFTKGLHLELYAGKKRWQSYLLKKGLPTAKNQKMPISKIEEIITKIMEKDKTTAYKTSSLTG